MPPNVPSSPSPTVKQWQQFLKQAAVDPGPLDGEWGPLTRHATIAFQQRQGLPATGVVDGATRSRAKDVGFKPTFALKPDTSLDLREMRPYFLVPLLEVGDDDARRQVVEDIVAFAAGEPFTDLFVLSHGWHRNLFTGVAAYDRLLSRMSALFRRGVLDNEGRPFSPLFLAFHWHSDTGEDGWFDPAGRRSKSSFLEAARAAFDRCAGVDEGTFLNDFEDLFSLFSQVSAPDVPSLDPKMDATARRLTDALAERYDVKSGGNASLPEKVALAWTCYFESEGRKVLEDQGERAASAVGFRGAVAATVKFVVAAAGIAALAGLAVGRDWRPVLAGLSAAGEWLFSLPGIELLARPARPLASTVWDFLAVAWAEFATRPWHYQALAVLAVAALTLAGAAALTALRRGKASQGSSLQAVLAWAPLQLACAAPLLAMSLLTFLFRAALPLVLGVVAIASLWQAPTSVSSWVWGALFVAAIAAVRPSPERMTDGRPPGPTLRDALAALARAPVSWLRAALPADSRYHAIANVVENQLAFYEMQRKGVLAGDQAGAFLETLLAECPAVKSAKIHLIGHSFGGLVMQNAARNLALKHPESKPLHTMTLIQSATGSNWLFREERVRRAFAGAIACIYSAYDFANGFYYPFANHGRMAAGYVGLYRVGDPDRTPPTLGQEGRLASLVHPPDLRGWLSESGPQDRPWLLNLDASRMIYEGSAAVGGGHDDLFKDDVVHLIWAVSRL